MSSFTYLGSISSKDGGDTEDVKSRITKVQGVFHSQKKFGRIGRSVCKLRLVGRYSDDSGQI